MPFTLVPQYTYLLTIPMIFCNVLGFAIIKYNQGYFEIPLLGSGEPQNLESYI